MPLLLHATLTLLSSRNVISQRPTCKLRVYLLLLALPVYQWIVWILYCVPHRLIHDRFSHALPRFIQFTWLNVWQSPVPVRSASSLPFSIEITYFWLWDAICSSSQLFVLHETSLYQHLFKESVCSILIQCIAADHRSFLFIQLNTAVSQTTSYGINIIFPLQVATNLYVQFAVVLATFHQNVCIFTCRLILHSILYFRMVFLSFLFPHPVFLSARSICLALFLDIAVLKILSQYVPFFRYIILPKTPEKLFVFPDGSAL